MNTPFLAIPTTESDDGSLRSGYAVFNTQVVPDPRPSLISAEASSVDDLAQFGSQSS
jgi:hypothetical protein